jgi:hypothetical protein
MMTKGTLKARAHQKNLLTNLTLLAEAEQEEFADVHVVTLKQHVKDLALEEALDDFGRHQLVGQIQDMHDRVNFLLETKYTSAKEYVLIEQDAVRIGVNKSEIDDHAIDYALSLLIQVESFNPGEKYEFGDEVTIDASQV